MLQFVARHGLVRLIGGRAVPALLIWDLAMLANKTRRIPAVDRGLRRGAGLAVRGLEIGRVEPAGGSTQVRLGAPGATPLAGTEGRSSRAVPLPPAATATPTPDRRLRDPEPDRRAGDPMLESAP